VQTSFRSSCPTARLLCFAILLPAIALGQVIPPPASVSLTASPDPVNYGRAVTLTATVTAGATGKVTFYDGATILGVAPVSAGQATLKTIMLPSGKRSLRAYYQGSSAYSASGSTTVPETVVAGASLGFRPLASYAAGVALRGVAVGDFNGDAKLDFAAYVANSPTVLVYLGNGDGTFQSGVSCTLAYSPFSIAAGDFDGDGKLDLAVSTGSNISVLKGNGDGTFQSAVTSATTYGMYSLAVGDFNGDGIADLAGTAGYDDQVEVMLGNGDGTFAAQTAYSTGADDVALAVGDFNGDGLADLAALSEYNGLQVLLGKGDGTFGAPTSFGAIEYANSFALGDFNGDGKADVAVGGSYSGATVLLGNGSGGFGAPVEYGPNIDAAAIVVEDFNGDGFEDIGLVGGSGPIAVLLGNGDGTFQSAIGYSGFYPSYAATGDFNGDGKVDVLFTDLSIGSSTFGYGVMLGGAVPDPTISASHGGGFTQGQVGAGYIVTVTNVGGVSTSGPIGVLASIPAVFTAVSMGGNGWTCDLATLTCVRSDILAGGAAYPALTIKVNVVAGVTGSATATFTVSGGGDQNLANNTASDTAFVRHSTTTTLASSPNPAVLGHPVTLTATVTAGATGSVSFYSGADVVGGAALAGGQAVFATYALPSGTASLRAEYSGDSNYGPSTSAARTQVVAPVADNGLLQYRSYKVDSGPEWIVSADFNGDGKIDLVTANSGASAGSVSVLLGNGDGTFRPSVNYPAGLSPNSAVVGDFNNDGKEDIAIAGASMYVLLGNGDGTFQAPTTFGGSSGWSQIVVADFNGDGRQDLAAIGGGAPTVFLGNGDGTFQPGVAATATGLSPSCMAVADMNGDGKPDLVVLNTSYNGAASVILGNGDGTFQPPLTAAGTSTYPDSLVVGDFNGDGKPDVAVVYWVAAQVFLGNGDGTLQSAVTSPLGQVPGYYAVAGDFNGDGKLDIAYSGYYESDLYLAFGNGDGTFQSAVAIETDATPTAVAQGDFNGDGRPDFAVSNFGSGTVDVFLGAQALGLTVSSTHTGTFTAGQTGVYQITVVNTTFAAQSSVTMTDILPAGLTPTALSASWGWTCTLSALTCTTTEWEPMLTSYPVITLAVSVAGSLSPSTIVNQTEVSNGTTIYSTTDPTRIVLPSTTTLATAPNPSVAGQSLTLTATVTAGAAGMVEFDDDGVPLGVAAIAGGQAILAARVANAGLHPLTATYLGDSTHAGSFSGVKPQKVNASEASGFATGGRYATGANPVAIAAADFNGDGAIDLVTANQTANTVSVLLGGGTGAFGVNTDYAVGTKPAAVITGDFNSDGKPDIAVANTTGNNVSILLGKGDGTFQAAMNYPAVTGAGALAVGDFNGDGKLDLLVGSGNAGMVLLLGNGDGTFQAPANVNADYAESLLVADLNGDGKADILFSSENGWTFVALGNGDGTFASASEYYPGGSVDGLAVGDLNADGKADIVVADGSEIDVLLGNGDGTFQNYVRYAAPNQPTAAVLADVNGDGKLDVVAASNSNSTICVLLGNGDGTLQPAISYAAASNASALVAGDFNGDGRTDLAFANPSANSVSVFVGVLTPVLSVTVAEPPYLVLGETGATFSVTVANNGPGATSGAVTVIDILTSGLTATGISGPGWTCSLATLTCTRADALAPGASYPSITLTVTVAGATAGAASIQVSVSGAGAIGATITDPTNIQTNYTYLVGDVAPHSTDMQPYFGDNALNIQDLIAELFAVNAVPGFKPAACTDRFDAMDVYPPDTATARGGDGVLDIHDLILELFRVNNLDTSRPVRASLRATCGSGSSGAGISQTAATRRPAASRRTAAPAQGALRLGHPEPFGAGQERMAVYLDAAQQLTRVALTFGLGDRHSPLSFQAAPDNPPSLVQDTQPGAVAVAWLNGLSVPAGGRLLLGYVSGPRGSLANLAAYGLSAAGLDDNRDVRLEVQSGGEAR
jgi:uncharacterized repeat protein (TIGR01451 family)